MFDFIKKASAKKSMQQISQTTVQLIEELINFEVLSLNFADTVGEELKVAHQQKIQTALKTAFGSSVVMNVIKSLCMDLQGPIPIAHVRTDIIKPLLTSRVSTNWDGTVTKIVFQRILNEMEDRRKEGKEVEGIDAI